VETPLAVTTGEVLAAEVPLVIVPVLRAGLVMVESCLSILPLARVYHLGLVRDEETLAASCYLNRLPEAIAPETRILITEPMLATGGTIVQVLSMLAERGADPALVRILSVICAPPALNRVQERFPMVQIYCAAIDEVVNERGWIVPGLGDAGDRAFGTTVA
jgi:uracil phosphoribosyltransferase